MDDRRVRSHPPLGPWPDRALGEARHTGPGGIPTHEGRGRTGAQRVPVVNDLGSLTWFFAHGSLMFSPGFEPDVSMPARAVGWERRFGQPSIRNWGRPGAPAPTCSLTPGDGCTGLAFGIAGRHASRVVRSLVAREASEPMTVAVRLDAGVADAFTWKMGAEWNGASVEALVEAAIRNIHAGGGPSGDAWDYVEGVAGALSRRGLTDPIVTDYHAALARRLEPDPDAG